MKKKFANHKKIAKNTIYLGIMECIEVVIPFIALPHVIKVIGANYYGKIAFAQSIVSFLLIATNFGLGVVAAKEIAINANNKDALGKIISITLTIKAFLFLSCFIILNAIVYFWDKTNNNYLLFNCCFGVCFADVIFTKWFYQGIEKMLAITIIRCFSLVLYISLIYLFLKDKEEYYKVPLFQSGSLIVTSLIGFIFMLKKERIKLIIPCFKDVWSFFRVCIPFFFSKCSLAVNSSIATVVIGATLGDYQVAIFDLAQKIAKGALIPALTVVQAVYPHNSRNKDSSFATSILFCFLFLLSLGLLVLYIISPFAVTILGHGKLPESTLLVRMFIPYIFMGSASIYLGTALLVAWGYYKPFNYSVYVSTIILLVSYSLFYHFKIGSPTYYCLVLFLGEFGLAFYRLYYCLKNRIITFRFHLFSKKSFSLFNN